MKKTSLTTEAKDVLLQLMDAIHQLTKDEYTQKMTLLDNASIGEHTRHIIELFHQLFAGYHSGRINYDNRKRDKRLQEIKDFALESILLIIVALEKNDTPLHITTLYDQDLTIETNYNRELLYNIEHCIHHQAIIRIGLRLLNKLEINKNFGLAKSTIAYRKNVHS